MAELKLIKVSSTVLSPATEEDVESLSKIKIGEVIRCKYSRYRSYKFHKKYFALLNHAFDFWEMDGVEYKGQPVQKNFERFREDIQILAGFGYPVVNINGEVRYRSKSISFGKMSEEEFEKLYSKVIDVILGKILTSYTKEDLDDVVDQIIGFV